VTDGPWREPGDETTDYPKFWVHDGRVTGQITAGQSRLPISTLLGSALYEHWDMVEADYEPGAHYSVELEDLALFLHNLLQMRGEFARLLCVLADVERDESDREDEVLDPSGLTVTWPPEHPDYVEMPPSWWELPETRKRVADALRACLAKVTDE
jgi:hypothetical protein